MKIIKAYVGSWYPRTVFHLNELYEFLDKGTSHLYLDPEKVKSLRNSLKPEKVGIKQHSGRNFLEATFNKYSFKSRENGLTLLSCDCIDENNLKKDLISLSDFAFKKIFASFSYLFSLGAPIPKVFSAMKSVMPYTIVTDGTSREEVKEFLKKMGEDIEKELINDQIAVYYGTTIVIVNGDVKKAETIVEECIYYLHDAESQFKRILDLHRFIWDEVREIKSSPKIKYKDLTKTRDLIMEIESEVVFFQSRIKQLDEVLRFQMKRVEEMKEEQEESGENVVCDGFLDGYRSLVRSGEYVRSLWEMTNNYLSGASKLVTMVYQESSNKQINILQFIFVISAVASIITLGTVSGFEMFTISSSSGFFSKSIGFSIVDLMKFGGMALIAAALFYFIWDYMYRHFAGSKISDPNLIANTEFEKIKKMLN